MKYKVGDKVRIRKDLYVGFRGHGRVYVTDHMARMGGRVFHISKRETDARDGITRYTLKDDVMAWSWTDDMFEDNPKHKPIVIYQKDDDTIVALDKETQKEGKAICSKDDKFDFLVGAKLALDRLSDKLTENEPTEAKKKRLWLSDFCRRHDCSECILIFPTCRCGCGTHFLAMKDGAYEMTDEEIHLAYALATTVEEKDERVKL